MLAIFISNFKTPLYEIPTRIWQKLTRSQCYIFQKKQCKIIISAMMRFIKLGSRTYFEIKIIPVTSLDIVIPSLSLFGFVLLYYLFCDVCSEMLTCLFCILFNFYLTINK